ncbi:MAG TPA: type 2 isopentenyl-diphosphate Delta-isomerase [Candidatus Acidoferrales bacterium]|nr:type 2 isopentenyl-diphosphate Delta-isomerase [Candidatus Acidoferrales bacterium]
MSHVGIDRPGAVTNAVAADGAPARKADHIRINLEADVAAKGVRSGFEEYRFLHNGLPEIDLAEVDTATTVLGRTLAVPLLISCMTGGTEEARRINRNLALVAQDLGLALGLGSGRVLLEHPELIDSFSVRPLAPDVLLFANLGAVQLNCGYDADDCRRLVELLDADALVLHLNALQEAVQPGGDSNFSGLLAKIERLCSVLAVPVVVKEVGWGLAEDTVRSLFEAGVSAVDVAGAGGTSWSEVERHRIKDPIRARIAGLFAGWGIPTADSLRAGRAAAPTALIFASGGIRDGIDAAKAIALGADLVGIAGPFLRAAAQSETAVYDFASELIEGLRVCMFAVGARTVADLRFSPRLQRDGEPPPARPIVGRLHYKTLRAGSFIDITDDVARVLASSGVREGAVHVYSSHTTAAIRVNENEELLLGDFTRLLDRLVPAGNGLYEHDDLSRRHDTPPDEPINGHAHCRHLLLSSSELVPVSEGRLALGRYQRIFLIELCSSRERDVVVSVLRN